jgi:Zn-dependent protease with chaperone function
VPHHLQGQSNATFRRLAIGQVRAVIAAHLAKRHAEYSSVLVLIAGALFSFGLIAGWLALAGGGIVVTAEEVFARRASAQPRRAGRAAVSGGRQ